MGLKDNKFYQRWKKWIWGLCACITLIVIILIAVFATRAHNNRYPDYKKLTYKMDQEYSGKTFFDYWDYYNDWDPAGGFVRYAAKNVAQGSNLTYATDNRAILRADNSNDAKDGRLSVRLYSQNTWNSGLFIWDIHHAPYACGLWPALWLTDPWVWPKNGEIDVFETVNLGTNGANMALHTAKGCKMNVKRKQKGTVMEKNCFVNATGNNGCSVLGGDGSAAKTFNDHDGGIVAMELRDAGIRMWQFDRDAIPQDITNEQPDPSSWGVALSDFPATECDMSSHFKNLTIVMNIDFCGDWVSSVYQQSGCPGTCTDYVTGNASAYDDAYFEFESLKVYASN